MKRKDAVALPKCLQETVMTHGETENTQASISNQDLYTYLVSQTSTSRQQLLLLVASQIEKGKKRKRAYTK